LAQERLCRRVSIPALCGVMFSATKSIVVHPSHCRAKWHYRGKLVGQYEQNGRREMFVNRLYGSIYYRNQKDMKSLGGEGGIRTPGTLASTSDFESEFRRFAAFCNSTHLAEYLLYIQQIRDIQRLQCVAENC